MGNTKDFDPSRTEPIFAYTSMMSFGDAKNEEI